MADLRAGIGLNALFTGILKGVDTENISVKIKLDIELAISWRGNTQRTRQIGKRAGVGYEVQDREARN